MILFFLLQNIIFRRAGPAVSLFRETVGLHGRRRRVVASSQLLSRYRLFIIDFSMSKHSVTREERTSLGKSKRLRILELHSRIKTNQAVTFRRLLVGCGQLEPDWSNPATH